MSDLLKKNIAINQLSSGILSTNLTDWDGLVSTDDTITAKVNYAGEAIIIDKLTNPFKPKLRKVSWNPVAGLVPPNADGNNLVIVSNTGIISIISSATPNLPVFDPANPNDPNQSNSLQIGNVVTSAGVIIEASGFIDYRGSDMLRISNLMTDFIGVINSATSPVTVERVGGNLEIKFSAGNVLSFNVGTLTNGNVGNPDVRTVAAQNPATLILVNRNSVIQSVGTNINVTQYESAIGTFSLVPNNRHKLVFMRIVPGSQIIGYVLGQAHYASSVDAADSSEQAAFPAILSRGANTIKLTVVRDETDLNNGLTRNLNRIE